jgi:hypothetical protein
MEAPGFSLTALRTACLLLASDLAVTAQLFIITTGLPESGESFLLISADSYRLNLHPQVIIFDVASIR